MWKFIIEIASYICEDKMDFLISSVATWIVIWEKKKM